LHFGFFYESDQRTHLSVSTWCLFTRVPFVGSLKIPRQFGSTMSMYCYCLSFEHTMQSFVCFNVTACGVVVGCHKFHAGNVVLSLIICQVTDTHIYWHFKTVNEFLFTYLIPTSLSQNYFRFLKLQIILLVTNFISFHFLRT
jgi:hypothetical protein